MKGVNALNNKSSKNEVIKRINEVEILDSKLIYIDRTDSISRKLSELRTFIQVVEAQIKDERDVLLIAIKCK